MKGERKRSASYPCTKAREFEPAICGTPALRQTLDIRAGVGGWQDGSASADQTAILRCRTGAPDSQRFRRIDDGVGVDAVVAIEVVDGAGLAEMLDAERLEPVAAHAAEPAERGRMAVDHGDDAAVARQRRQ